MYGDPRPLADLRCSRPARSIVLRTDPKNQCLQSRGRVSRRYLV